MLLVHLDRVQGPICNTYDVGCHVPNKGPPPCCVGWAFVDGIGCLDQHPSQVNVVWKEEAVFFDPGVYSADSVPISVLFVGFVCQCGVLVVLWALATSCRSFVPDVLVAMLVQSVSLLRHGRLVQSEVGGSH